MDVLVSRNVTVLIARRTLLAGLGFLPVIPLAASASLVGAHGDENAIPFSREWLRETARERAGRPYAPPRDVVSDTHLDYDRYRSIRFRAENELWFGENLPFLADFFHAGGLYRREVLIHEVREGFARPIPYDPGLFVFHQAEGAFADATSSGFAGLRLHHPINHPADFSEFALFLGASYFRAVGRGDVYGISARGIAVEPGGAEEFPDFTAFWVERPSSSAEALVVHALLDGPSLTGAYRFEISPGDNTVIDIEASLFPRTAIANIGLAPLTSMFMRGPIEPDRFFDFRPRIHDSDGLAIRMGDGDEVWRPLANPRATRLSRFAAADPQGFGLLQRPRAFESYLDLEARYDRRPGLWVEPMGEWGEGEVCLLEFPTPDEVQDNIVAYWRPARALEPGERQDFRYRLHWGAAVQPTGDLARVTGTYTGDAGVSSEPDAGARKFVIDFAAGARAPRSDEERPRAVVEASNAEVLFAAAGRNRATGGWRVFFDLRAAGEEGVDISCAVALGGETISETWTYRWDP